MTPNLPLPFPMAVLPAPLVKGNHGDEVTAIGLYAWIGALLCASWLVLFYYLSRHPELLQEDRDQCFFARESTPAWIGCAAYGAAGVLGYWIAPWIRIGDLSSASDMLLTRHGPVQGAGDISSSPALRVGSKTLTLRVSIST